MVLAFSEPPVALRAIFCLRLPPLLGGPTCSHSFQTEHPVLFGFAGISPMSDPRIQDLDSSVTPPPIAIAPPTRSPQKYPSVSSGSLANGPKWSQRYQP